MQSFGSLRTRSFEIWNTPDDSKTLSLRIRPRRFDYQKYNLRSGPRWRSGAGAGRATMYSGIYSGRAQPSSASMV
ncbi:unnamed protein product [Arctia plantaginis]|uniref:Uncharacterized protein n=1 Tax=Arctia plantaginis TaxID=874455 RepID=A0A8S1AWE1_ARCPL|nr:unnamed protein product [Arctia plantaginis]